MGQTRFVEEYRLGRLSGSLRHIEKRTSPPLGLITPKRGNKPQRAFGQALEDNRHYLCVYL